MKNRAVRLGMGETTGAMRITRRGLPQDRGHRLGGGRPAGDRGMRRLRGGRRAGWRRRRQLYRRQPGRQRPGPGLHNHHGLGFHPVLDNVMEGLYRLDPNAQTVPAQAQSVDISDDGLTYTFTLRDGIKWSNGDP